MLGGRVSSAISDAPAAKRALDSSAQVSAALHVRQVPVSKTLAVSRSERGSVQNEDGQAERQTAQSDSQSARKRAQESCEANCDERWQSRLGKQCHQVQFRVCLLVADQLVWRLQRNDRRCANVDGQTEATTKEEASRRRCSSGRRKIRFEHGS